MKLDKPKLTCAQCGDKRILNKYGVCGMCVLMAMAEGRHKR